MSFTQKKIEVTFTLSPVTDAAGKTTSQPVFAGSDANSVTLKGLRISANIHQAGGASQGEVQLRIYGMALQLMNQLSTLGRTPVILGRNEIAIYAGDDSAPLGLVFKGTITQAYTDLGGAPEGMFQVSAYSLAYQAVQSIPPTSFKGSVDVVTILQGLAKQMNLSFEPNDVKGIVVANPYHGGSAKTQAEDVIKAAKIIDWNQGDKGVLAIWYRNGFRNLEVPTINTKNGMVGYPYPSGQGLLGVKTRFNPNLNFGARVNVESIIGPANGLWTICSLTHDIESEMPGGQWFSSLMGTPPGYLTVQG